MISGFPLDLSLTIEELAKTQTRIKLIMGDQDEPTKKGWPMYAVPIGFGWRKAWGQNDKYTGQLVPSLLYTGLANSNAVSWVPLFKLRELATIPSHTPGRKSLELWKAAWAQ